MEKITVRFEKIIFSISKGFNWVAAVGLMAMVVITCADVVMRSFGQPLYGAFEIVRFLSVIVVAFAMAHTQVLKGHTFIELFIGRLSKRVRAFLACFTFVLSMVLFLLLAWQSCVFAMRLKQTGEVSMTLEIPFFPLVYGIALGAFILALVLFVDLVKSLSEAAEK